MRLRAWKTESAWEIRLGRIEVEITRPRIQVWRRPEFVYCPIPCDPTVMRHIMSVLSDLYTDSAHPALIREWVEADKVRNP